MMSYIDIDGDGRKDVHISYPTPVNESGSGEISGWKSGYDGAWYFKNHLKGLFNGKK